MMKLIEELGGFFLFIRDINKTFWTTTGNFKPIIAQISEVSFRSLPTVIFAGFFVGAILVLQFNLMLSQYDAAIFLGGLNTSAVVREVGPLIISFLLAGKVGAYTAAELGTMRVTEQIDAVRCLGTNPIQYLILPRFVGIILSSIILLIIGLMVSIGGSMLVADVMCGVNTLQYLQSVPRFTDFFTFSSGLFRAAMYGFIVAGVCCFKGYTAKGGARGVGKAVTEAALYTHFYIVLANYLSGGFLHFVERLVNQWMGRF